MHDDAAVATTSAVRLDGDDDHARPRLGDDVDLVAASVSRDRVLVPTGEDDADGGIEVEEVDFEPRPRKGAPKTMRELAESHAQRKGEVIPPPPSREEEGDLAMTESEGRRDRVLEEGSSRRGGEGPGPRTTKRRPGTKTTRTSRKRQRRRSESEGASDVDGEVHPTPPKRRQLEAVPVSSLASTSNSDPGSGRVLRPRPQKSAAQLREERVMEEAYRRAVAG